ncbi:MAG: hypothetical protein IJP98_02315 [Clostridia bacterium]|nr:hypothetical protein [Clostridia bacterium]
MKPIREKPEEIFKEVDQGKGYKTTIDLFETVKRNEAFYTGDQWRGMQAETPDLLLVQLNFLQRVCAMFISKVVSDDIAANLTALKNAKAQENTLRTISGEIEAVFELLELKRQNRQHVRDAIVDGDTAAFFWFDADAPTGQAAKGAIRSEIVENINVIFGNPYSSRVEEQPYIIVLLRKPLDEMKDEARKNGIPESDINNILPDSDDNQEEEGDDNTLVTVAVKLWKDPKSGSVQAIKTTEHCLIRGKWDTLMRRYPLAWMSWEKIRNSYHGRSAITGLIPNQIALNKTYTSIVTQIRNTSFPKLIYSDQVKEWDPSPAKAIKVPGTIDISKVATYLQGAPVNPSVTNVMDSMLSLTRDCMGVSDATMGNVRPENAAAIIALQTADNYPIELHRQEFYAFVEAQVRIIIDMMRAYYGKRQIVIETVNQMTGEVEEQEKTFEFSTLTDENVKVRVDIGASSYWSETMQVQTLNNIFTSGVMNDPEAFELFLQVMPDKYVPHKQKLIDFAKRHQQQTAPEPVDQQNDAAARLAGAAAGSGAAGGGMPPYAQY